MTTERPTTRIGVRWGIADHAILKDGVEIATFDREPDAQQCVEFLHVLDHHVSLWRESRDHDERLEFDGHARSLLENVRVMLSRALWEGTEGIRLYRMKEPLQVVNGLATWLVRRLRDDHVLLVREESLHQLAARCLPPDIRDPHPLSPPDEAPDDWREWLTRNAAWIGNAVVADYHPDLWFAYDFTEQDAFEKAAYANAPGWVTALTVEGVGTWGDADGYALAC